MRRFLASVPYMALWQARLSTVVTAIALGLAVIACPVAVYAGARFISQPFAGVLVEQTGLVNEAGDGQAGEWPAKASTPDGMLPLTFPDRILRVDGQPFTAGASIGDLLSRAALPTTTLEVQKARRDSNTWVPLQVVRVTLERKPGFPPGAIAAQWLLPLGLGVAFLALGLWVFAVRRDLAPARAFANFCACVAIANLGLFDMASTHWLTPLWAAALPLAAGAIISLALQFPQEVAWVQRNPFLRWLPYVPSAVIALVAEARLYDMGNPMGYAEPWSWGYGYAAAGIVLFLFMMAYRLRSPALRVREQSRVILYGSAVAFAPLAYYFLRGFLTPWLQSTTPFVPEWYLPSTLVFPAAISYALVRYRLLDVDKLLSRGLAYAIVTLLAVAAYYLVVALPATWIGTHSPVLVGVWALVVVAGLNPLYNRVQRLVNRLFSRGTPDYADTLKRFSHELTLTQDLGRIVSRLRAEVQQALGPGAVWVFLGDQRRGGYVRDETQRLDTLRFASGGPLARWLAQHHVLVVTPGVSLPADLGDDRALIASSGLAAAAALTGQHGLIGWIGLSARAMGGRYGPEELAFLEALADQSSLAIERAQVVNDLERRLRELNVLSQVSQAVSLTLSFEELLDLIYMQAGKVVDTTHFGIVLYDDHKDELRFAFVVEDNVRRREREGERWSAREGLSSLIVRTAQPIVTADYVAECERRGVRPRYDTHAAWMGMPLNAGSHMLGVLYVFAPSPDLPYDDDQAKVFAAIADQAATAIEKTSYLRELESRARQLATLNEVSASITSTLDLQTVLNLIMDKAVQILDVEAASLCLTDYERNELEFRVNIGPAAETLTGRRLPLGTGVVGEVAKTGQPIIVNDVEHDPRWFRGVDETTGFLTRAILTVPLIAKDLIIGVIEVINKKDGRPFEDGDLSLLASFGAQAAAAIENARLFSLTDQALAARLEELSVMQQIDRELNAAGLNLERVLQLTLDWAMRNTGATAGTVGLVNWEQGTIQLLAARGYRQEYQEQRDKLWPLDLGIAGRVVRTGQPSIVDDVTQDPDYVAAAYESTRSQLTVPILREGVVAAYIVLESNRLAAFKPADLEFAARLADHAAVAIENARLYGAVKRANDAKTEFVSFVSHELKTPMTSIRGYTDLLEKGLVGPVTDMQKQFLGTIRSNVERMSTLVSDLNDTSRIESGRLRLNPTDVSFRSVVEETVHATRGPIDAKHQTLDVEMPDDLPKVHGDQVRLGQVLTNLLSNANKYTPEGGHITVRVTLQASGDGAAEFVRCEVQDTGIGMSAEDQQRLFQKFFRSENPEARQAPGWGLGLHIVKNLVELQGGQVTVQSALGQGSTFAFTMPVAKVAEGMAA